MPSGQSIFEVFVMTAVGFAGLSALGYFTKKDLVPVGTFCTMGLFGLIGWGLLAYLGNRRIEKRLED